MKAKNFLGKLIAIDMYNCDIEKISDVEKIKTILEEGCSEYSMMCKEIICCKEDNLEEYSMVAVCLLGHVALHVYPAMGFITADVFSCYSAANPAAMAQHLRLGLDADKTKLTLLDRGDFGSESDMKPSRRSRIKFIRRTTNLTRAAGSKLKEIILKPRSI